MRRAESGLVSDSAAFNGHRRSGDVGRNPPQPALVSFYKGCGLRRNECMVCRAESASFADSAAINGHRRSGERNAIPPYKDFTAAINNQRRSGERNAIPPYKDFTAAINGHRRSGQKRSIPPYKDFTAAINNQRRKLGIGGVAKGTPFRPTRFSLGEDARHNQASG